MFQRFTDNWLRKTGLKIAYESKDFAADESKTSIMCKICNRDFVITGSATTTWKISNLVRHLKTIHRSSDQSPAVDDESSDLDDYNETEITVQSSEIPATDLTQSNNITAAGVVSSDENAMIGSFPVSNNDHFVSDMPTDQPPKAKNLSSKSIVYC